jgi:coproporphyrinogen III oxidase
MAVTGTVVSLLIFCFIPSQCFVPTRTSACAFSLNGSKSSETFKSSLEDIFNEFSTFILEKQVQIISKIEEIDGSGVKFSVDRWGMFSNDAPVSSTSGGITRVIQGGNIVEKGACSLTLLQGGKLTAERASSIQGRQQSDFSACIQEGDTYAAAALSMVLHTRSPMVPTFRSDVRIFMVQPSRGNMTLAWFGGGSDLTPYYLFDEDITAFHSSLKSLCEKYQNEDYEMFFDDMPASNHTLNFVKGVCNNWMPSWFPIVTKRKDVKYTDQQRQWQLLRRGRYLEFNLLYDRGVKFGLANVNPRVEGVMVSAPPLIAWEYNHEIAKDSEEERLMNILKNPINWV